MSIADLLPALQADNDDDLKVHAVELEVTEAEAEKGIEAVTSITYKRMTIVVVETADDLIIGGICVSRDHERAEQRGRDVAHARLDGMRLKHAERQARLRMKNPPREDRSMPEAAE